MNKADVVQRVGEDLAVTPIGQALQSQDEARITAAFLEIYERLKKKGLATWAYTAEVPTELVPSLSLMIAEKLLISYSVPELRYNRIKAEAGPNGRSAELALAELIDNAYESVNDVTDY
jgi:hypothetical protein